MAHITIRDLARMCSVSVSTASNAYNRPDQLSEALRMRILAKADEVGYAGPAPAARSLRRGKTGSLGVLFAEPLSTALTDPYNVELLRGISRATEDAGNAVVLLPGRDRGGQLTPTSMRQASVDGIISMCAMSHPAVAHARLRDITVVGTFSEFSDCCWAAVDDVAAGRQLGSHLGHLGHRHIGVIGESSRNSDGRTTFGERARGLTEAIADVELTMQEAPSNTVRDGYRAAVRLLDNHPELTAIVGSSDVLALGALQATRQAGLSAGVDISIAGYDDLPQLAAEAGLTTIAQPIFDKGRIAAQLLLEHGVEQRRVLLPTSLVVRRSTGPARA